MDIRSSIGLTDIELQDVSDSLTKLDLDRDIPKSDLRTLLVQALPAKPSEEIDRLIEVFEDANGGTVRRDLGAFVDWLQAAQEPSSSAAPAVDAVTRLDSQRPFDVVFQEKLDEERWQVEGRVQRAFEEKLLAMEEATGAALPLDAQLALQADVEACDAKSHPPWRLKAALSKRLVEVVVDDLLEALAPDCTEAMEISVARALSEGPETVICSALYRRGTMQKIAREIHSMAMEVSSSSAATGAELNDKFITSPESGFEMVFGAKADFFGGLEERIGSPNPSLMPAIIKEHCGSCDSMQTWTVVNSGVTTTSCTEFLLVMREIVEQCQSDTGDVFPGEWHDTALLLTEAKAPLPPCDEWPTLWPEEDERRREDQRRKPREQCFLLELMMKNEALHGKGEKQLSLEEGALLRLYTGPLFDKYNIVPRGGALTGCDNPTLEARFRSLCGGDDGEVNRYTTSIHTLTSGVVKLSKLTPVQTVYRGLGGNVLPKQFWEPDEFGCKGGVEYGFMSTTANREVALDFSGDGSVRMVMEFETGLVDRGADLQSLSQYPDEQEILFPPLTSLEVRETDAAGSVLILKTKMNINLRNPTIDETVAKRYQTLTQTMEAHRLEAKSHFQSSEWMSIARSEDGQHLQLYDFLRVVDEKTKSVLSEEAAFYNSDEAFMTAMQQLVQIAAEVRDRKSSLLRDLGMRLEEPRLVKLADEREAMEMSKQLRSFSFTADTAGMGQLWLFRVMGLQKAQDGLYYPMNGKDRTYRDFLLNKTAVASRGADLPQGMALLSANGRRDIEAWALQVQETWRKGATMDVDLMFCGPRSSEEFSQALRLKIKNGETDSTVRNYLLSNLSQQELDLDRAGLGDDEGQRLFRAVAGTSGRLTNLELLILSTNDLRGSFAASLAAALAGGCLPRLKLLQLFNNTALGSDSEALEALLEAVAEHCCALEVLDLSLTGIKDSDGGESFETTWTSIFGKLFQRLQSLQFHTNENMGPSMALALASGLQQATAFPAPAVRGGLARRSGGSCLETKCMGKLPLKRLWLHKNPKLLAGSSAGSLLMALAECRALEELRLAKTGLAGSEALAALRTALPSLGRLRELTLYDNPDLFSSADGDNLGAFMLALGQCTTLEELRLNNSGLCAGAEALAGLLGSLTMLSTLILSNNPKCFSGNPTGWRTFLKSLNHCPNLQELTLMNTGLCLGAGVENDVPAELPYLPKLRKLWLQKNPKLFLEDAKACRELVGSLARSCPAIEKLWLNNTGLWADGLSVDTLASAIPKLPKLTELMLHDNAGIDESAKARIRDIIEAHGGMKDFKI